MEQYNEKEKTTLSDKTLHAENACEIKVIDEEGYDIEQFLCRCSNKTSSTLF